MPRKHATCHQYIRYRAEMRLQKWLPWGAVLYMRSPPGSRYTHVKKLGAAGDATRSLACLAQAEPRPEAPCLGCGSQ